MSHLVSLKDDFGKKGLNIIAIVNEDEDLVWRYMAHNDPSFNYKIALGGGAITIESAGTPASVDAIHKYVPPASTGFDYFAVLFRVEAEGTNEDTGVTRVRDFYIPRAISIAAMDVAHTKGANPSLVAIDLQAIKPSVIAAQGTLTMDTQPTDTDTYTVGSKTYTFQDVLTDVDGNVDIGGSLPQAKLNLVAAMDLSGVAGTDYALSMTANTDIDIAAFVSDDAVLTAKVAGSAGNAIATTETFTAGTNIFDDVVLGFTTRGYGDIFETYEQAQAV